MNKKAKILMASAILMIIMMAVSTVYAWYWVWGDNFNDNYLAYYWHVLKNNPNVSVQETEQCIKIDIPRTPGQDWASGALRLDNFTAFDAGTVVWVDITSWGSGWWDAGPPFWTGPRVGELVLSNEIYDPMSAHVRVAVKREYYTEGIPPLYYHSRTFATLQVGDELTYYTTVYDIPGPEQGYTIAFGIERTTSSHTKLYFWTSYDDTVYTLGEIGWFPFSYNPFPIFGAYGYHTFWEGWWVGVIKFDDFNIYSA